MDGEIIATVLPHSSFGAPDCCGCLCGIIRGHQAELVCNECSAIVRTVPPEDLERIIDDLELSMEFATAICPHCRAVNIAPGFSKLTAFVCDQCGEGINLRARE